MVFSLLAVPLLMTNPPVIGFVSNYAADNPITLGLPTFWLWIELWYGVMLLMLIAFASWVPSWRSDRLEEEVEQLPRRDYREE